MFYYFWTLPTDTHGHNAKIDLKFSALPPHGWLKVEYKQHKEVQRP